MLLKLDKKEYNKIGHLTKHLEADCTFVYGVIENGMPGAVYADALENPQRCFITSAAGKYLIVGDESNEYFNDAVVEFLKKRENHILYYDFYAASSQWMELLSRKLKDHSIRLARTVYSYNLEEAPPFHRQYTELEKDFELKRMDESLFYQFTTTMESIFENHWGSAEEFLSKGLGYCIVYKGEIASICFSFNTGGGYAEIGVITKKQFSNKGFALITSSAYIEECIEKRLTPIWDAGKGNAPSNQLARKLGFDRVKDTELIFWHENDKVIQSYLDGNNFM